VHIFGKLNKMQQTTKSDLVRQKETEHKGIVLEYFKLIASGNFKEGLRFFAPDCITHNPFVAGSMGVLTDAMVAANSEGASKYPEAEFAVKHILADGDLVAAHTQLLSNKSKPNEGGLRQVHIFRFEGDKIVEYWDITQQVASNMPNAGGAF
jgi:predicted SnoaL-like aldol condensation-catalyzing enzyme